MTTPTVGLEIGGSGLSGYSPISTLERQQYEAPPESVLGRRRIALFIKANANCCLEGGVEGILKLKRSNLTMTSEQQTDLSETGSNADASESNAANYDDDPFSFLSEGGAGVGGEDTASNTSIDEGTNASGDPAKRGGFNVGRFVKKVAKSTTKQLERGMHTLAIKADKGRNPDLMVLGLYNANTDALLSMTDSQALPSREDRDRYYGLHFMVPLVVPPDLQDGQELVIKLWIRSGATLLQQTKTSKNFLVGSGRINVGRLRSSLQKLQFPSASFFHLTLQSALVVDGTLSICMTQDLKFPPLCGWGWSLADPDINTAYARVPRSMFNLPLDQSYSFTFPEKLQTAFVVATERTTESTLVLPIATAFARLAMEASKRSLHHAQTAAAMAYSRQIDSRVGEYADCSITVSYLNVTDPAVVTSTNGTFPVLSASWQRPDSLFEVELTKPARVAVSPEQQASLPAISFRFFPKACRQGVLPSLLQANGGTMPTAGFMLGTIRFQVNHRRLQPAQRIAHAHITPINPFDPAGHTSVHTTSLGSTAGGASVTSPVDGDSDSATGSSILAVSGGDTAGAPSLDCLVNLDALVTRPPAPGTVVEFPVMGATTGRQVGTVAITISIQMATGQTPTPAVSSAQDGLVSLVGLPPVCLSVQPSLDYDAVPAAQADPETQRRIHQLLTMGQFMSFAYIDQHIRQIRTVDCQLIEDRAKAYYAALTQPPTDEKVSPHQDRTPKPFRPSSSRPAGLLSGIPFNVHTASFSLNVMQPDNAAPLGSVFCNTTCGAPADHARGFGNVFAQNKNASEQALRVTSPVGSVSGGLRRLEAKRREIGERVTALQNQLIARVGEFFAVSRQSGQQTRVVSHVPAGNSELQNLKLQMYECVQALHHVTWICAVRRANVFSQALGIAVTTYLASISDPSKFQSTWPDLWARHGYLVSFEGLLSAAGKELGMIEDASVGISMLRMVQVVFVPDDGNAVQSRTPVPFSPYVKWIDLRPVGQNAERQFVLQIGIVPSYMDQRIPPPLRSGTHVRLFSLLFEVGVDIRQWGANKSSNVMTQFSGDRASAEESAPVGLIDDEDGGGPDDVGVTDDDVLVQLNYEAFQLLNMYAHLISPANSQQTMDANKTHPLLENLYQHIVSSSGKMNHSILDEAASLAQQLGGGAAIFCKSGKDRTAMHVTFKQAQFANRFREGHPSGDGVPVANTTLQDAMVIRVYGTRLPICEKNVGEAKYAFNALQVKFMPEALKPPMNTLAGFLKGGKVFTGGAIES